MSRTILAVLAFGFCFFAILPALSSAEANSVKKKYKFLLFGSITGGSHYLCLAKLGRALVRHGHGVVSLISTCNPSTLWENDVGLFPHVVFNSSYTKQDKADILFSLSSKSMKGFSANSEELSRVVRVALFRECDALFNDSATMKRLHEERFDMLIADDCIPCSPLLAQALDIPFVLNSVFFAIPTKHGQCEGTWGAPGICGGMFPPLPPGYTTVSEP
ncbi:UDP-glucuronosyltransferase 2B28-like, partial [Acanthaster planci]|uniref:UDP-glucuronosyltransferase 2B28-like n=1 Tax=Acanthaster planci TaxID=133434 RepID=A0A8B8A5R4_ACAPL